MARFREPYSPRQKPGRFSSSSSLDDLSLHEVGLGPPVQMFLFVLSLFPMAGITIGVYYANNELHYGTRTLGRTILTFGMLINFVYFCVLCPFAFYLALG